MLLEICGEDGRPVGSTCRIDSENDRWNVIIESRGGARGSRKERNTGYSSGFRLIIQRLASIRATILSATVDSTQLLKQGLNERDRSIAPKGLTYPIHLDADNANIVAQKLQGAQAVVGRQRLRVGKNNTRRVRFVVQLASELPRNTSFADYITGGNGLSPLRISQPSVQASEAGSFLKSKKELIEAACVRQGARLRVAFGNATIPRNAIVDAVVADCGCTPGEVLVTDRCYNRTNKGIRKADGRLWQNPPLFIQEGRGQFRYLGPGHPYTGYVYHKPQGEAERIVARCENGLVVEWLDELVAGPQTVNAKRAFGAYLVTYNKKTKPWENLPAQAATTLNGQLVIEDWNVANLGIHEGDRLYILKQGTEPRGVMGVGRCKSPKPELRPHYDPERAAHGEQRFFIDGEWSAILNPATEALLADPAILDDIGNARPSGIGIKEETLQRIDKLWPLHLARVRGIAALPPDNDAADDGFLEGGEIWRLHRSFERSPELTQAKKQEALGRGDKLICSICTFDFRDTYGDVGQDFIECHHLVPLGDLRKERRTKLDDVILVCSNCHRMLHRKRPHYHTQVELKALVVESRSRTK